MSTHRENLQSKLDAFRTALIVRRNRFRHPTDPPREVDPEDLAADELLAAAVAILLHTHALVEALASKKGIRR
jgi:hypothetical protein